MTIITNETGLPLPIVEAIRNDTYDAGDSDISVTRLIQPPRKVALEKLHAHEITEDAADRIWALQGQLMHLLIERAAVEGYRSEERVSAEVLGWQVSGAFDLYFQNDRGEHVLMDLKFVSVWEAIRGPKEERAQQLNLLAELMRRNSEPVDRLEVIYVFRDWSKLAALRDENYPQRHVLVYFIPLWPEERAAAYLAKRVAAHQQAQAVTLPDCSDDERWYKGTKYALRKVKNKRAERVLDTFDDAFSYARDKGYVQGATFGTDLYLGLHKDYVIEERPGENTRCLHYCSAAPFCTFAQSLAPAVPESEEVV